MVRRGVIGKIGAMKTRYRKYTNLYMFYLNYLQNELEHLPRIYFKRLLTCGFWGIFNKDCELTKNKRQRRLSNNYRSHI